MNLGGTEILIVLFVALLLFGGKRLPELARGVGRGLAEFRRATQEVQREVNIMSSELSSESASKSKNESVPVHDGTSAQSEPASRESRSDS